MTVHPRPPLDAWQRPMQSLRVSVTDRCNLRCSYCMPEEHYRWLPSSDILRFEEIGSLVDVFLGLGVRRVRLTGGEPLLRRDLPVLVAMLAQKPGLQDLALTTNGVRLAECAHELRKAGLHRLTVSLDTLDADTFQRLSRRNGLSAVLKGLETALEAGFSQMKIDTVVLRGVNEHALSELLQFARGFGAEIRFIEYMDVGGATRWTPEQVVSRREILERLSLKQGPFLPLPGRTSEPAERFQTRDGQVFGIIASTTAPFCQACDRSRLTADGHFFTCLYAQDGFDLKTPLRRQEPPAVLQQLIAERWAQRQDRGAEERLSALQDRRTALFSALELQANPRLEMHTRGG